MTAGRLIGCFLVVGASLLLGASSALASTVTISSSNRISVTGEGSERNAVFISYDMGLDVYTVVDSAGADGSAACTDVNTTTVTCPGAGIAAVTVKTGSGADVIVLNRPTMPATIEGSLDGGTGNDYVYGANADDSLIGGSNSDFLDGGPGADELRGSGGSDIAYYGDRTTPLSVTVGSKDENDGNEVDQSGAARDTVRGDIELVIGGAAGDTIVGDGSDETILGGEGDDLLLGGRGDDTILAGGGNDFVLGENGHDVLRGEDGNDRLKGGDDGDRLVGGLGDDILKGQRGVDVMKGKFGIDRIFARDGTRDAKINCGPGANSLEKAKRDKGKRNKRNNDPRAKSC